jgi:1-pyrroline-5-carboxylate dehydrogenase
MPAKKSTRTVRRPKAAPKKRAAAPKIPRITYATLTITPKDDQAYDSAVATVQKQLGKHFTNFVNGQARSSDGGEYSHASPVDTRKIVSYFPKGTRQDAQDAVRAAHAASAKWSAMDYRDRLKLLRRAADLIIDRRYELSAWMAFEVGKNRAESLAEPQN